MEMKEFEENCKKIMASTELTAWQKELLIEVEATRFADRIFEDSREYRDWQKRLEAAERRLAGHNGFSYCPHDGEWSPERPPEIRELDREYETIKHRYADGYAYGIKMKLGSPYASEERTA